jgi:hypothetical protein
LDRSSGNEEINVAARMFPFWIAAMPQGRPPVALGPGPPHHVAAFTSLEKAQAFVGADSRWELRLVCRATFGALAKKLRRHGLVGVSFDPQEDGCPAVLGFDEFERLVTPAASSQKRPKRTRARRKAPQPPPGMTATLEGIRLCSLTRSLLQDGLALRETADRLSEELREEVAQARLLVEESRRQRRTRVRCSRATTFERACFLASSDAAAAARVAKSG